MIELQRKSVFGLGGDSVNNQCAGWDFYEKGGKRQKYDKDPMGPKLQGFYESTENNPTVETRQGLMWSCVVSSAKKE